MTINATTSPGFKAGSTSTSPTGNRAPQTNGPSRVYTSGQVCPMVGTPFDMPDQSASAPQTAPGTPLKGILKRRDGDPSVTNDSWGTLVRAHIKSIGREKTTHRKVVADCDRTHQIATADLEDHYFDICMAIFDDRKARREWFYQNHRRTIATTLRRANGPHGPFVGPKNLPAAAYGLLAAESARPPIRNNKKSVTWAEYAEEKPIDYSPSTEELVNALEALGVDTARKITQIMDGVEETVPLKQAPRKALRRFLNVAESQAGQRSNASWHRYLPRRLRQLFNLGPDRR